MAEEKRIVLYDGSPLERIALGETYKFGRELGEKIKKRAELVRVDDTGSLGISDGSSYISVDLPMVASKGLRQIQGSHL